MSTPNDTRAAAGEFWRSYRCRCRDSRTGEIKPGIKARGGCQCPLGVYVGKRRAKLMARLFAKGAR